MRILIRGWRFLPHSYAMVNQFQLLEMLERPELTVYHEDAVPYGEHWTAQPGLFAADAESALRGIGPPPPGPRPDVELRISYPFDIAAVPRARRTYVFATAEFGVIAADSIEGGVALADAHRAASDVVLITPSNWSREGLLRSGADASRLEVVPHGVDPSVYAPPSAAERHAARAKFGVDPAPGNLVFLHVGGAYGNKGLAMLLRAFAQVLRHHPCAQLLVKGLDSLYPSRDMLAAFAGELSPEDQQLVQPRLLYVGKSLALDAMRQLYHAADCYVSPYFAEGFNLPVLEAAACGLPVLCTAGGPTDDFTTAEFALRIDSARHPVALAPGVDGVMLMPSYEHLVQTMRHVAERAGFRERARSAGPAFVRARFTWKHAVDRLLEVFSARGL
jgi:glycosyltransferase involved in cell wall biosynthesis